MKQSFQELLAWSIMRHNNKSEWWITLLTRSRLLRCHYSCHYYAAFSLIRWYITWRKNARRKWDDLEIDDSATVRLSKCLTFLISRMSFWSGKLKQIDYDLSENVCQLPWELSLGTWVSFAWKSIDRVAALTRFSLVLSFNQKFEWF